MADVCNTSSLELSGCVDRETSLSRSSLSHVPYTFRDPSQLLHLKNSLFFKHISNFSSELQHLQSQVSTTLGSNTQQTVIIGLSCDKSNYPLAANLEESRWLCHFLFSYMQTSALEKLNEVASRTHLSWKKNDLLLLDKLDVTESLNYPMVHHREDIAECLLCEDIDRLETETMCFELNYNSLMYNMDTASSILIMALSSLINTPPNTLLFFEDIMQSLMQHCFWISTEYFNAFINVCSLQGAQVDPSYIVLQLPECSNVVLVSSAESVSPFQVLKWYKSELVFRMAALLSENISSPNGELLQILKHLFEE